MWPKIGGATARPRADDEDAPRVGAAFGREIMTDLLIVTAGFAMVLAAVLLAAQSLSPS
jgi:hypothetical protein